MSGNLPFTANSTLLTFDPPRPVGTLSNGSDQLIANINGGTLTSEPGVTPTLDAVFEFGADHFVVESDKQTVRIDVKACLKNKDGSFISYAYLGTINVDESFIPILTGSPDAQSTKFGNIFTFVTLESGADSLKGLQNSKYIGCSRFVVTPGQPPVVESKISKAVYTDS